MNNTHTGVERERVRGIKYDPKGFCLVNKKNGAATNEIERLPTGRTVLRDKDISFGQSAKLTFTLK